MKPDRWMSRSRGWIACCRSFSLKVRRRSWKVCRSPRSWIPTRSANRDRRCDSLDLCCCRCSSRSANCFRNLSILSLFPYGLLWIFISIYGRHVPVATRCKLLLSTDAWTTPHRRIANRWPRQKILPTVAATKSCQDLNPALVSAQGVASHLKSPLQRTLLTRSRCSSQRSSTIYQKEAKVETRKQPLKLT